ncbi:hypothetical protein E2C06_31030 [Dankookia rubra]|uniref:CN hydrolase domain-containing protein n=1 Tax=Dankookia rubra TaxID=1442381 RepID=A0A4R5Q807_9PROT|nr:hypothetical protein [Dankookia rubra]TDH58723.1 hypothetical protein E2C06_31030 [Dankookia rubra]
MNRDDWLARARAIAGRHAQAQPEVRAGHGLRPGIERLLLAELHALVCAAPLPLLDAFRHCPEEALAARVEPRIDALWEERFGWAPEEGDDPANWLMAAILQVRALDQALAQGLSDTGLGPRLDPRQWAVPEHRAYVVPRSPWRLDGSVPKRGEPYSRRGLRHHTVLPMEVGGLRVRPVHLPTSPLPGGRLALGAALFRQPALQLRAVENGPHGPGFLAEAFTAAEMEATIARQAAAAFADGCFAAVWPELTMPPEARQVLARHLAFEALRHGPDRPLRLVVAGSWHEPREKGGWSNLARVLGRTGEVLCSYAKFAAFHDETWGEEAIVRGNELPVLVTGDLVVGLAICKDFCDRAVASPFAELPVDLILVPSMGRASTLAGHLANSEDLRLRTGTIVFVVQQLPVTTADPAQAGEEILGHVLLSRRKAMPVPQASTWAVHVASRVA